MALLEKNISVNACVCALAVQKCSIKTRNANRKEWEMSVIAATITKYN